MTDNVREAKDTGMQRHKVFEEKRITSQEEAFTVPIQLTKLKLLKASHVQPRHQPEVDQQR